MRHLWRLRDPPPAKGGMWTCGGCGCEVPSYGVPVNLTSVHNSPEPLPEHDRHLDVVCRWREKPANFRGSDLLKAAKDGALIPTQVPADCRLAMVWEVMKS